MTRVWQCRIQTLEIAFVPDALPERVIVRSEQEMIGLPDAAFAEADPDPLEFAVIEQPRACSCCGRAADGPKHMLLSEAVSYPLVAIRGDPGSFTAGVRRPILTISHASLTLVRGHEPR